MSHQRRKIGSRVKRQTPEIQRHDRRYIPKPPTLGGYGMSVFRRLAKPGELDGVQSVFKEFTKGWARRVRGEDIEKDMALSQLSIIEVKRSQALGDIAITDAIDEIYRSVRSVRRPLTLQLGNVGIFGHPNNPQRIIGIAAHLEDVVSLNSERAEVITSLEHLSGSTSPEEYYWFRRTIPHISLGRVTKDLPDFHLKQLKSSITDALPETIQLSGATLFDPSTAGRK